MYYHRKKGVKYNNTKIQADGHTFDSKHEYQRYCELKLLERSGAITDLQMQVKFVLIPSQYEPDTVKVLKSGKEKVVKGKLIERECSYIADFVYQYNGKTVVEDAKSPITRTKEYIIKRKLMLERHNIRIQEV